MIIDMNALIGRWPFQPLGCEGPDDVLELMDRAGIDQAVITSLNSVFYYDAGIGNHEVGAACQAHPDRFIPFAIINPNLPRWREHLKECVESYGVKGIKLHPDFHKYSLVPSGRSSQAPAELMAEARHLDLPVYLQTSLLDMRHYPGYCFNWQVPVEEVAAALEAYPDNTFVIGGGRWFGGVANDLVKRSERAGVSNFSIAVDGLGGPYDGVGDLMGRVGVERLLLSTRSPVLYAEAAIDMVQQSFISEQDQGKILGGNAARLLGLS